MITDSDQLRLTVETPFNPYHRWLGIRLSNQPYSHYDLLGLAPFEEDLDVIENAANRQMGHIRTFQTGKYRLVSQRILNELSAAKLCLLHPTRKREYDQRLAANCGPLPASSRNTGATVANKQTVSAARSSGRSGSAATETVIISTGRQKVAVNPRDGRRAESSPQPLSSRDAPRRAASHRNASTLVIPISVAAASFLWWLAGVSTLVACLNTGFLPPARKPSSESVSPATGKAQGKQPVRSLHQPVMETD